MGNMTETFFGNLDAAATWSAGVAFKRSKALPLDKYSVFETKALAEEYAEKRGAYAETPVSYPGQVIVVSEGDKMVAYVLAETADGTKLELQQIGIIPSGEDVIDVTEDGKISLNYAGPLANVDGNLSLLYDAPLYINDEGKLDVKVDNLTIEVTNDAIALKVADKEVFKKDEEGNLTEEKVINAGAQLILQADGTIKWVQPDTSTAEGQAAAISALQDRATALEKAAIKPAEGAEAKPDENLWDALEAHEEAAANADKALSDRIGAASEPESSEGAGDAKEATGVYVAIEAEVDRATKAEEALGKRIDEIDYVDATSYATDKAALEQADADLDTAVKAAQKAADDANAAINDFLTGTGAEGVIDSLTEIQNALDSLTDASELATAIAGKADKVEGATEGNFAGLDANGNLTDSGKKAADFATAEQGSKADAAATAIAGYGDIVSHNASEFATAAQGTTADNTAATIATYGDIVTHNADEFQVAGNYEAAGAAAQALEDAKADTNTKLANYYNKTDIDGMNLANKTDVSNAVAAEAEIARAAEEANANAIAAITKDATIKTLKGIEDEITIVKDSYATKTEAQGYADAKNAAIAAADAKGAQGIADAAAAKSAADAAKTAADAAQATANTNAANTDELEKVLYGRVITGTDEYPETVDKGLIGDLSEARTRLSTAEGTIAGHTTAINDINTALGNKAESTALAATDAKVAALEGIVGKEAEGETPASGLVASVAALDSRLTAEETKVDKDTTYTFSHTVAMPGMLTVQPAGQDAYQVDLGVGAVADTAQEALNVASNASGAVQDLNENFTNFENNVFTPVANRVQTAEDDIDALQETIKGLSGAMHFEGVKESIPSDLSDYEFGDVIIVGNKEYVCAKITVDGLDGPEQIKSFVEFGDVSANSEAISELYEICSKIEDEIGWTSEETGESKGIKGAIETLEGNFEDLSTETSIAIDIANNALEVAESKVSVVKTVEGSGLKATETVYGPDEADELGIEPGRHITIGWDNTVTIILDGGKA